MAATKATSHLASFSDEIIPWVEETGTQFHYDPLRHDAIRLLELEPSLPQDPIRCKLLHVNSSENHQYEILSCDWQSSTGPHVPVSLNGQTFDVPSEVYVALRRVRLEGKSRLLWLEAICINQQLNKKDQDVDEAERNIEASYLRNIYQGATGLLAWIGSAKDNSHLVFEHLDKCREHRHINWCHYKGETEEAFNHLSHRSWFYRTQSAQELALTESATILCGRHQGEWPELIKCTDFLGTGDYYHPLEGPDGRTHLYHLRQLSRGNRVPLRNVFLWNRHGRVHDPRDKIFSALVLDTGIRFDIPIDYRQDLVHLFRNFTQRVIETSQTLEVLHWLGSQKKFIDGLPSWVPDYSIVNPISTLPRIFSASAIYSIHYPTRLLPGFEFRPNGALVVHGRAIEKVEKIGDELDAKIAVGSKEFHSILSGWENLALGLNYKRFPQAIIDAFADTLIGDDRSDLLVEKDDAPYIRDSRPSTSPSADEFHAWYGQYGTGVLRSAHARDEASNWIVQRYVRRMEMTSYGRRFFTTDEGSMGLAPPHAREGDDLVFIPGGKYPFVLRARDDGTHELIGDCFLYDLDVFALLQNERIQAQEFVLT
ncbi:heterokaryon incompatibility protein-domain-containing protein [Daldinia sp. FL1419]|nr:heterokaryon incompatibility protein-domain-containing protein [Daldinia sp. FL1419]